MKTLLFAMSFLATSAYAQDFAPFSLTCEGEKMQVKISSEGMPKWDQRTKVTLETEDETYVAGLTNMTYEKFASERAAIILSNKNLNMHPDVVTHTFEDAVMLTIHPNLDSATLAIDGKAHYLYCSKN